MTDAFWIALPGTIAAVGALYAAIRTGRKVEEQKVEVVAKLDEQNVEVEDLKAKINGQTHALITAKEEVARMLGEQLGLAAGKEQAKTDAADLAVAVSEKQGADEALRAQGQMRTRRDDIP